MCSLKDCLKILIILTITNLSVSKSLPTVKTKTSIENILHEQQYQISWLQQMRILRHLIKECENSSLPNSTTWQCLKITTLNIFDDVSRRQIIPVWRGVRLVRMPEVNELKMSTNLNDSWQRKDLQYLTWFDRLALSFTKLLNTHMLEINLKELTDAYMESINEKELYSSHNTTDIVGTARHRRQRFNMMITMMFGVTALGSVLVPMGFQLLSVVSGKALLLAKMALLLASINGLKRVANTGLHYGLYHVPGEHYPNYYDRGDVHHPRNVQTLTPHGQPLEVGLQV